MNDATEFPDRYYRASGAVPVLGTLSSFDDPQTRLTVPVVECETVFES